MEFSFNNLVSGFADGVFLKIKKQNEKNVGSAIVDFPWETRFKAHTHQISEDDYGDEEEPVDV